MGKYQRAKKDIENKSKHLKAMKKNQKVPIDDTGTRKKYWKQFRGKFFGTRFRNMILWITLIFYNTYSLTISFRSSAHFRPNQ